MSDNKNGCKPKDASILDYYHKLSPYRMINQIADSIKQTVGAAEDLMQNRSDMAADRTIGNDKYFHCKGNCEATRRGPVSEFASTIMSDAREYYQTHIKRPPDKIKDSEEDEELINMAERMPIRHQAAVRFARDIALKALIKNIETE